jgi:hypothetical protein
MSGTNAQYFLLLQPFDEERFLYAGDLYGDKSYQSLPKDFFSGGGDNEIVLTDNGGVIVSKAYKFAGSLASIACLPPSANCDHSQLDVDDSSVVSFLHHLSGGTQGGHGAAGTAWRSWENRSRRFQGDPGL